MNDDIEERLETHDNSRQKCSICDKCIPKDVLRVSFGYRNSYGGSAAKRICQNCILRLGQKICRIKGLNPADVPEQNTPNR